MSKIYKDKNVNTIITSGNSSNNTVLNKGELYIENSTTSNGDCRLKIGDGITSCINIPYTINSPNMIFKSGEIIQEPDVNISSAQTTTSSSISTTTEAINEDLSYITTGTTLSKAVGSLKSAINRSTMMIDKILNTDSSSEMGSIITVTAGPKNGNITVTIDDTSIMVETDSDGTATFITSKIGTFEISAQETNPIINYSGSLYVPYFSKYSIELANDNIVIVMENVSFDDAYNGVNNYISSGYIYYVSTMFRFYNGNFTDFYYSNTTSAISSLAWNSGMTRANSSTQFYINNDILYKRSPSNANIIILTFLKDGYIVKSAQSADVNNMASMKNRGNIFTVDDVVAGEELYMPYLSTSTSSTWVSYYAINN